MIYFTTFILTLLLSHIARATPACGDVASPEELYDPMYADARAAQHALPIPVYDVVWSNRYDDPNGATKNVACWSLLRHALHFKDFAHFPYIGGAFNIKQGSQYNCGQCWQLTNGKTKKVIYIVIIDTVTNGGFNISKTAYNALCGGSKCPSVEAIQALPRFCDGRK